MKRPVVSRRQILRGAGGFTLGLPFLPSLVPGPAHAADPVFNPGKRFVSLSTQHGALWPDQMYPADATLTGSVAFKPGHSIKHGALAATLDGNYRQVSPILRAPASVFTDKLVAKMNVLRGFDIHFYIGHHTGGHLGNFSANDQGPKDKGIEPFSTIDQVMAWSSRFYSQLGNIKMRSIVTGEDFRGDSWAWSNPTAKTGAIQKVAVDSSSLSLFDKLFVPATSTVPPPARRKPIIDLVVANYRSLRQSNRRLSLADKQRLDDHLSSLAELQRSVNANATPPLSCGSYSKPALNSSSFAYPYSVASAKKEYQLINDVIAMAFACGTSRIATVHVGNIFSDYAGDWHQEVAHQAAVPSGMTRLTLPELQRTLTSTPQVPANLQTLAAAGQASFEGAVVDLAAKLDAIVDAPGTTVLDNTHCQWTQESGWSTHSGNDLPIVVFGGAGGYFKTGQFVDFRSQTPPLFAGVHCGIGIRQWLAAVLQAMGIPPEEFESKGKTGYGDAMFYQPEYVKAVHPDIINRASDPLPVITAGV